MSLSYEAWRITFQSSEQAARDAYAAAVKHADECDALTAHVEHLREAVRLAKINLSYSEDAFAGSYRNICQKALESTPETSLAQRDARVASKAIVDLFDFINRDFPAGAVTNAIRSAVNIRIASLDEIAAGGVA